MLVVRWSYGKVSLAHLKRFEKRHSEKTSQSFFPQLKACVCEKVSLPLHPEVGIQNSIFQARMIQ